MLSCDLSLITMHISDCCQFSDIHISQGSVATYLRCGGIFKYEFVANLPMSLPVKEFWKSVDISGSYGQEFSVLFFWDTVYIDICAKNKPPVHKTGLGNIYCLSTFRHARCNCNIRLLKTFVNLTLVRERDGKVAILTSLSAQICSTHWYIIAYTWAFKVFLA